MSRKTNSEAFIEALEEIDGGLFIQEAGDALANLVKQCQAQGKKGGMSISIGLKPNSRGQLEVICGVEAKMPKPDKYAGIFFGTEQGLLQRRDPRQPELPGLDAAAETPKAAEPPQPAAQEKSRKVLPMRYASEVG